MGIKGNEEEDGGIRKKVTVKDKIRPIFRPILNLFESSEGEYSYKPSHRTILLVIGCLFTSLSTAVLVISPGEDLGYLLPVGIFGGTGFVSLVVGFLGTDRAVAKIWGSR